MDGDVERPLAGNADLLGAVVATRGEFESELMRPPPEVRL